MSALEQDHREVTLVVEVSVTILDHDSADRGRATFTDEVYWNPDSPISEQIEPTLAEIIGQFDALQARTMQVAGLGS